MPWLEVDGIRIWYTDSGGDGEVVLFSHGLLWSGDMFDAQVAALSDKFRCITYDHRGQGRSDVPRERTIEMETLYADVLSIMDQLDIDKCHFVGLSMGGFIGLRVAVRRPERLHSLTLLETSADPEPKSNLPKYRAMNVVARLGGLPLLPGRVMPIMFGKTFLTDPKRKAERDLWRSKLLSNRRHIYRAVNGVVKRKGVYDELRGIVVPTLIMVGDEDVATVPEKSRRMHERIEGSKLVMISQAGHTSTVEQPEQVNQALQAFLEEQSA